MKNIRDLSRITGYSISTISRYINKSGYVSEKASQTIQDAIEKENYHVNNLARTLFTKKSNLIACVLKHLQNPYYTDFIEALDVALSKEGYQLIISHTQGDISKEQDVINNLIDLRVDGIFIFNGRLDQEFYENCPVNIIALNKYLGPNIPFISTNDEIVGNYAAEHMITKHVKNPAFIDYNFTTDVGIFRYKGFHDTFAKNSISVEKYYFNGDHESLAKTIYENNHDGVFFYSDYMAIPTNIYLQRLNSNIVVTSCDKIESLKVVAPNIHSIEQNVSEIIQTAIRIVKNEETELVHKLEPKK